MNLKPGKLYKTLQTIPIWENNDFKLLECENVILCLDVKSAEHLKYNGVPIFYEILYDSQIFVLYESDTRKWVSTNPKDDISLLEELI